jgi:hypothetical protein
VFLQEGVRELADRLTDRRASLGPPYVVVLGTGYARAAGVPKLDDLVSSSGVPREVAAQHPEVLLDLQVPTFYQDLVVLAASGSLPVVVTTSYDRLFEQALFNAGMRPTSHFTVHDAKHPSGRSGTTGDRARTGISIIRLFGLEDDDRLNEDWLHKAGIPDTETVDLIMVGYEYESPAFQRWLSTARGDSDLWWANEKPFDRSFDWPGQMHELDGDATRIETLFGQLSLLLIRLPTIGLLDKSDRANSPPDDEWLDRQYVQNQLQQVRVVKRAIEASTPGTGSDPAVASQLAYQREEIGRLEGELRSPANVVNQLLGRFKVAQSQLHRLAEDGSSSVDPESLSFIDSQIQALENELTKATPNRLLLAAAEGALQAIESQSGIAAPDMTSSAS